MDQKSINALLALEKEFLENKIIFPPQGKAIRLDVRSTDGQENFIVDVNRKYMLLERYTYQERYISSDVLVRVDVVENRIHRNPDNEIIVGPHVHIWREGYGIKWAYNIEKFYGMFRNTSDILEIFEDFCSFCNITNFPMILSQEKNI